MFDDPGAYLWLIPLLPLLGSAVTAALGPGLLGKHSHWPCIAGAAGACFFALVTLIAVAGGHDGAVSSWTWFEAGLPGQPGSVQIKFSVAVDGLSAIMLSVVTFVGLLIAIYSIGYMQGDPGYPRFFALISLFLFSMTGLVLANNFILLYAFWEGVGLCSYLLIGFWYARPAAAAAARKAFLVTRLGDVGLFIGILILWRNCGFDLSFDKVFSTELPDGVRTAACLLLFLGAVGKSAQFPLHVWLPDAMEGPSPVSALIHAATMVTAGVYLVARCTPLFMLAPNAQLVVACIGGFTALLAAIIALTQTDLKRVLAYSTISQLGYMFLALGCGLRGELRGENLVLLGVYGALFHLFTHAFFKALLFLAAGSVMHAMGGIIDMRKFGGLRKLMPITHWTFLCGAGALAGVPLVFSGFWSKDEILAVSFLASHGTSVISTIYFVLAIIAMVTAGLTAFYTARAYFLTFWGEEKIPPEAGHHAHESPPVMTVPLIILSIGTVGAGLALGPTGIFEHFLKDHWTGWGRGGEEGEHTPQYLLMAGGSVIALAGIVLAGIMYLRPLDLTPWIRRFSVLYEMSRNHFYLDEIYGILIVRPLAGLAQLSRIFDTYIVDGLVDLLGQVPRFVGFLFQPIQNGLVQFYALLMALGLAGFLLSVLLR